jgi:putative ABC transport system permease protein
VTNGELVTVPGSTERLGVGVKRVDPGYFAALDIPLLAGRGISEQDREDSPPVIVLNQEAAAELASRFGLTDPVGRFIELFFAGYPSGGTSRQAEIVGVIRSERVGRDLRAPIRPTLYLALAQAPRRTVNLIVRTRRDPGAALATVREAMRRVDPALALANVRTLTQVHRQSLSGARDSTWVIGAFAILAGLLAALGLYGVVSQDVSQRRREIGIRLALGAERVRVIRHVVGGALALVGIGLAVGLAGAFALTRLLGSLLYQVSPLDLVALTLAVLLMTAVGIAASLVPALRAARVDPMAVIREAV